MDFDLLTKQRRSVRSYRDASVSREDLEAIIQAAQLAPTWKNSQTGRYYVINTTETLVKVREALPSFNQKSSANAALIVTTFVKNIAGFSAGNADNECGNEWGAYDLGLQNAYMVLKASDLGLDTLIMGLRDAQVIRSALSIPAEEEVMAVIAVGNRGTEPVFKPRKPLEDIAKFY